MDNVPMRANEPLRDGPFALHDDSTPVVPIQTPNPQHNMPLISTPPAMNVVSNMPMSSATMAANAAYRTKLTQSGAIWQYYQLVMTQWPKDLNQPNVGGGPMFSIPGGTAPSTAYANPAMETYFQTPIQNGCMNCHSFARGRSDFLWGPVILARDDGADESSRLKRDTALRSMIERLNAGGR